jgi:hypothetical protein
VMAGFCPPICIERFGAVAFSVCPGGVNTDMGTCISEVMCVILLTHTVQGTGACVTTTPGLSRVWCP